MTQMTNGDSVWKRTAMEWQTRAEKAEAEVARLSKALAESCNGQRHEHWPCVRAVEAETEAARLRAALETSLDMQNVARAKLAKGGGG